MEAQGQHMQEASGTLRTSQQAVRCGSGSGWTVGDRPGKKGSSQAQDQVPRALNTRPSLTFTL